MPEWFRNLFRSTTRAEKQKEKQARETAQGLFDPYKKGWEEYNDTLRSLSRRFNVDVGSRLASRHTLERFVHIRIGPDGKDPYLDKPWEDLNGEELRIVQGHLQFDANQLGMFVKFAERYTGLYARCQEFAYIGEDSDLARLKGFEGEKLRFVELSGRLYKKLQAQDIESSKSRIKGIEKEPVTTETEEAEMNELQDLYDALSNAYKQQQETMPEREGALSLAGDDDETGRLSSPRRDGELSEPEDEDTPKSKE